MTDFYDRDGSKADRALVLREKHGLPYQAIADRLCVSRSNIAGMLQRAKQRRAQAEVNRILERTAETAEKISG